MVLGAAGLALGLIGLAALWFPIELGQHDVYGFPVKCGNGFNANLAQAAQNAGGDFVTKCDTALLTRRVWAIPSVAVGWLLFAAFLYAWAREAPAENG
jgi:hypothetical protein